MKSQYIVNLCKNVKFVSGKLAVLLEDVVNMKERTSEGDPAQYRPFSQIRTRNSRRIQSRK